MDGAKPKPRRALPRGINALPKQEVEREQRARLAEGLTAALTEKGYAAVSVADVLAKAGVSRRTFYQLFADKEDCFLAAYEESAGRLAAAVAAAYADDERPWPERVARGVEMALDFLAADPPRASLLLVEVLGAGPRALDRRERVLASLAVMFADAPVDDPTRQLLTEAVVGGLYELAYARVVKGEARALRSAKRDFLYVALVPFLGHEGASAHVDSAVSD